MVRRSRYRIITSGPDFLLSSAKQNSKSRLKNEEIFEDHCFSKKVLIEFFKLLKLSPLDCCHTLVDVDLSDAPMDDVLEVVKTAVINQRLSVRCNPTLKHLSMSIEF